MDKKYILLVKENSGYEGFYRFHYKLFNDYIALQKHLLKFKDTNYIVFEETNIRRDKTLLPKRELY